MIQRRQTRCTCGIRVTTAACPYTSACSRGYVLIPINERFFASSWPVPLAERTGRRGDSTSSDPANCATSDRSIDRGSDLATPRSPHWVVLMDRYLLPLHVERMRSVEGRAAGQIFIARVNASRIALSIFAIERCSNFPSTKTIGEFSFSQR